jgi:TPP-dependent pyruvate/acetoin dehydrogenase alpha subunit
MPLREIALHITGASSNGRILPSKNDHAPNLIPTTANPDLQISLATGAALAYRNENNSRVVVAFLAGDWQSKPGSRETLSFAAGNELPIVYVSRTTPGRPGDEELDEREALPNSLAASGMTVIPVDGNDVVAVYRVAQESIHRARLGSGPTLIDARMDFSFGPTGQAKKSAPAVSEPIALLEAYLTAKGLFSATWKRKIEQRFGRELDAAWKSARPGKKARLSDTLGPNRKALTAKGGPSNPPALLSSSRITRGLRTSFAPASRDPTSALACPVPAGPAASARCPAGIRLDGC